MKLITSDDIKTVLTSIRQLFDIKVNRSELEEKADKIEVAKKADKTEVALKVDKSEIKQADWEQYNELLSDAIKNKPFGFDFNPPYEYSKGVYAENEVLIFSASDINYYKYIPTGEIRVFEFKRINNGYFSDTYEKYGIQFRLFSRVNINGSLCDAISISKFDSSQYSSPNIEQFEFGKANFLEMDRNFLPLATNGMRGAVSAVTFHSYETRSTYASLRMDESGLLYSKQSFCVFDGLNNFNASALQSCGYIVKGYNDSVAQNFGLSDDDFPIFYYHTSTINGYMQTYIFLADNNKKYKCVIDAKQNIIVSISFLGKLLSNDSGAAGQYAVSDGNGGVSWNDSVIINSSTEGSTKKFRLTVDDSGTISATEVV